MRPIIVLLMAWCLSMGAYAATAPDAKQISQELEQAKAAKPAQPETVESLQSALNALEERKGSLERAQQYQQVIDNFPKLSQTLRAQLANLRDEPRDVPANMTTDAVWLSRSKSVHVKLPTPSASSRSSKPTPVASLMKLSAAWVRKLATRRRRRHKILVCRRNRRV